MTKEDIYDSQISPLMAQVLDICKANKIAMIADFTLDNESGLQCTSVLVPEEFEPSESLKEAAAVCMGSRVRSPLFVTTRDGNGNVTRMDAIL